MNRAILMAGAIALLVPAFSSGAEASTVVIDPGHGGARSGARSDRGDLEKAVAFAIAKVAAAALTKRGVRVIMTRTADRNVELDTRALLANNARADAFISIHANWAPVSERRGVETYVLSAQASDAAAEALIAKEEEGLSAPPDEEAFGGARLSTVQLIVRDLRRDASHRKSARLARSIQDHLGGVPGLRPSRGLRQAPFRVLKRARVPAVLVEVGYLSNRPQAAFLATRAGQRKTGAAIARGVRQFLRKR